MTISEYIECINKAYEKKFPNKGFFVSTELYEKLPFPLFKKLLVKIIHMPSKDEVFSFTFQDKVPTGKENEFKDNCLKEIISIVTYKMEEIGKYGLL